MGAKSLVRLMSGAESGLFGRGTLQSQHATLSVWRQASEVRFNKKARWVLGHVIGQPVSECRKRLFRAPLPGFCWELVIKSKPEVRLVKSAEFCVLAHVVGQPDFGCRVRIFRAL